MAKRFHHEGTKFLSFPLIFMHKRLWDSGKDIRGVSASVQAYVYRYILKTALLQRECKLCLRLQAKPALRLSATIWACLRG